MRSPSHARAHALFAQVFWRTFRIVVVDDSKDLDMCYSIVQRFKDDHPHFAENIVYVAMAKPAAPGAPPDAPRVGEQFKPGADGLLAIKTSVGYEAVRAEKAKTGCDEAVVSMMDEDDTLTAEYHVEMLAPCAAGIASGNPIMTSTKPKVLITLVAPRDGEPGGVLFHEAPSEMYMSKGAGATFHYPLQLLQDQNGAPLDLPLARCAEDVKQARIVNFEHGRGEFSQFVLPLVRLIHEAGWGYLERTMVNNWWANEDNQHLMLNPCDDQEECLERWTQAAPSVIQANINIANSGFLTAKSDGGQSYDMQGMLEAMCSREPSLQQPPPSAFELWDAKRGPLIAAARRQKAFYDKHCCPFRSAAWYAYWGRGRERGNGPRSFLSWKVSKHAEVLWLACCLVSRA
jgi:hypothetical protein